MERPISRPVVAHFRLLGRRHSYHGDPTRREALAIFLNGVSGLQHYSPAISPECDSLASLGSKAIRYRPQRG